MTATSRERTPLRPVRRGAPCPVCGRGDWCSVSADGGVAVCMRVAGERPTKNGGWLHRLDAAATPAAWPTGPATQPDSATPKLSPAELVLIDRQCRADLIEARLVALAERLHLSPASLRSLGVGWHDERRAFTFPMRDATGRIVGIRTRDGDGGKRCLAGSRLGLFLPDAPATVATGWQLICEGESDAAAARDLGFDAVGRPGCEACRGLVVEYVARQSMDALMAVVADADGPGQRGGHALAGAIAASGRRVRVLTLPGAKDVRAFKATPGGTHHHLLALLEAPADRTL